MVICKTFVQDLVNASEAQAFLLIKHLPQRVLQAFAGTYVYSAHWRSSKPSLRPGSCHRAHPQRLQLLNGNVLIRDAKDSAHGVAGCR